MDAIFAIFKQLGVDDTLPQQFVIVVVLFFVLKSLLFSKLQEVLEMRENKTNKLEGTANLKLAEADELERQYNSKIETANTDAHSVLAKKKSEVTDRDVKVYKTAELSVEKEVTAKRNQYLNEVGEKKVEIMKSVDELSTNLVEKIVN